MAKNTLPVNFKDDIMNSSMGGLRRYKMINNSDGTVSFEDATSYDQVGSNFGAGQANATNQAVNAAADAGKIIDDMDAIRNVTQEGYIAGALALKKVDNSLGGIRFGVNGDGSYGYYGADDSFIPFKRNSYVYTKRFTSGTTVSLDYNSDNLKIVTYSSSQITTKPIFNNVTGSWVDTAIALSTYNKEVNYKNVKTTDTFKLNISSGSFTLLFIQW